jgi:NAD(P)-dependent dehydrogenase (short-subunit alcohol dehydrogenase family)
MILITGASKGIGEYLLKEYSAKGEAVSGTYFSSPSAPELEEHFKKVDITNASMVREWFESLGDQLENITLINCAGVNYNAFAHKADIGKWQKVIEINLMGSFNVIQAILPYMRAQSYGRIVNLSSVVAQKGICGTSSYAASKSGLWGMVRSLAMENATKGITINNLNLGYYNIGMIKEIPQKQLTAIVDSIPMGRLGNPKNIYQAVDFLRNSDYITGTSIDINGGLV